MPASRSTENQEDILMLQDVRGDDIIKSDAESNSALAIAWNGDNEELSFKPINRIDRWKEPNTGNKKLPLAILLLSGGADSPDNINYDIVEIGTVVRIT